MKKWSTFILPIIVGIIILTSTLYSVFMTKKTPVSPNGSTTSNKSNLPKIKFKPILSDSFVTFPSSIFENKIRYLDHQGIFHEYNYKDQSNSTITQKSIPAPRSINWSPNNQSAFITQGIEDEPRKIYLINFVDKKTTPLSGQYASWKDDKTIVVVDNQNNQALLKEISVSGDVTNIGSIPSQAETVSVNPVGSTIALLLPGNSGSSDEPVLDLYFYDITTKKITKIQESVTKIFGWSKDGILAFSHFKDNSTTIQFYKDALLPTSYMYNNEPTAWLDNQLITSRHSLTFESADDIGNDSIVVLGVDGKTKEFALDTPGIGLIFKSLILIDNKTILSNTGTIGAYLISLP